MRAKSEAEANRSSPVTHKAPWTVADVRAIGDYRLWVRFVDGAEGEVDLSNLVLSPTAGVFGALRDPGLFAQVNVAHGSVTWPGEIDLAPDAMYDQIKANGRWIVPA